MTEKNIESPNRTTVKKEDDTVNGNTNVVLNKGDAGNPEGAREDVPIEKERKKSVREMIPESEINLYHVYYNLIHRKDVTVCDEWSVGYTAFRDWALSNGYKDGARIIRKDKSKPFQPDNTEIQVPSYNANMKRLASITRGHTNAIFKVSYKD